MPRPTSPIRLQLDPGRIDKATGKRRPGYWLIRDGEVRHRTGCREDDRPGAEVALQVYLAKRHLEAEPEPNRAASQILVADVLTYYAKEVVDGDDPVSRPREFLARTDRLLSWWGTRNLAQVNGFTCKSYARDRGSLSSARRELEDMRAAIKLYHQDGLCRDLVPVVLPRKHRSRLTYFERDDVARLLWHCWRAREVQKGVTTDKRHLRHLIPFILTAVYTGSRSAKIWQAGYSRAENHAWIDLEAGVYHRLGTAQIEKANKRAGSVKIPDRLLVHMRRWQRGPVKDGVRVPRQWLCEYRGRPADPKGALARAMDDVFGEGHPYVRHTFRHTAASWLIWSGEKLDEIASYLSMTVEVLISTYGHDHPEANLAIGQAFSTGRAGHRKGGQRGKSRRDRGLQHAEAAE